MNYNEFQSAVGYESGVCQIEHWHGLLCGLLSVGRPTTVELLHRIVYEMTSLEGDLESTQKNALEQLLQLTAQQLADDQFEFSLLLPDDNESLSQRTQALSDWCDAFLYGLSVGGLDNKTELSPEASEFIADLSEISRVQYEGDLTEDDEFHFNELVEYVRVGVMLIYQDQGRGDSLQQKEH